MNKLSTHEEARLHKLICEANAAVVRIEKNLQKVTDKLTQKQAA
jgi:hypothetical protein